MLYWKMIERCMADNRIALSDGIHGLTFHDIHHKTAHYCAVFQSMGIKFRDRIMVTEGKPLETVCILMACIAMGWIFVPISRRTDSETRKFIIDECCPVIILDSCCLPKIMEDEREQDIQVMERRKKCPLETLVYIIYTSGSEGVPKGVVASQKQIFFCTDAINKRLENTALDRILCSLPLSFDYGLYQVFLALFSGAILYFGGEDMLQSIPYLLLKWKITAFPTIPTVANLLLKTGGFDHIEDTALRYISFTGEVLPVKLIKELKYACPNVRIVPMYGATECKRVSIMPAGREDKVDEGSCGLPMEGVEVYLISKDDKTGIGELVVEGYNVMEGYWNALSNQSEHFFIDPLNGKKVFRTGDLFRIDDEGFLFFCGRKNNLIKVRGFRVSSIWIENRLNTVEGVIEAAVFGRKDEITGEHLEIFVYASGQFVDKKIVNCMEQMPDYLDNYQLHISRDPLPKNNNGKINYKRLRDMLGDEQ